MSILGPVWAHGGPTPAPSFGVRRNRVTVPFGFSMEHGSVRQKASNLASTQGDQSRSDHDVCVYKLDEVCSHICGSFGAGSYMRHSRLNMPVDKVVVLELIVILLRAQTWEPL